MELFVLFHILMLRHLSNFREKRPIELAVTPIELYKSPEKN
jgi:hypothetical protein